MVGMLDLRQRLEMSFANFLRQVYIPGDASNQSPKDCLIQRCTVAALPSLKPALSLSASTHSALVSLVRLKQHQYIDLKVTVLVNLVEYDTSGCGSQNCLVMGI